MHVYCLDTKNVCIHLIFICIKVRWSFGLLNLIIAQHFSQIYDKKWYSNQNILVILYRSDKPETNVVELNVGHVAWRKIVVFLICMHEAVGYSNLWGWQTQS